MPARLTRAALVALAVVTLATAGIAANFVLLGYADPHNDPVGKLTPRADIITQPASTPAPREGDDEHSEEDVEEPDD